MTTPVEFVVDFPALFVAARWVEQHCVVPDGFDKGRPFELADWQEWSLLNFYRVRPKARVGQLAPAFHWRRAQIVLPQKAGKAPYTSAHICVEGVGPALFAGWAKGGELYDCRDHGCGCGWEYEYEPGEPMGRRWPTPLIQITATSEKQTDNIYSALRPMIDDGPLTVLIPKTGEEFIRLPNGGRIDVVTSNAQSRLGARVTYVPQDETGIWLPSNGMRTVAETQRRGLAGMGGRAEETTNAWDPTQESVAQRTAASKTGDIFRLHPLAPKGLSYTNKAERRKIHKIVYEGCPWVDPDAIEGEAAELVETDPGQAERFFGNRCVAGEGVAFNIDAYEGLAAPRQVPDGATVVLGIDGARHDDALAVVAVEVKTGYMWPIGIWERPDDADDEYEHPRHEVDGAVREAFEGRFNVWRAYCDDQYIEHLIEGWQNSFGEKRVIVWRTNRPRQIAWAVRNLEAEIAASAKALIKGETPTLTHSGDPVLTRHFANARKRTLTILDDKERPMHTLSKESDHSPLKIDGAMASVLAWEARGDAIAKQAESMSDDDLPPTPPPKTYGPGEAPPADWFDGQRTRDYGPMGSLS